MTTPGGVPNLPDGALTEDTLSQKLHDMSAAAMHARAGERMPTVFHASTGGNPLSALSPFSILTRIWAELNAVIARADPADINGPEDIPGLLWDFITGLPVVEQLVGLLEAIFGEYDGDDQILLAIQQIFGPIRKLMQLLTGIGEGFPTLDDVLNVPAHMINGLLSALNIPGLDASKIISGQFAMNMITGLLDVFSGIDLSGPTPILSAINSVVTAIPGVQPLINAICVALGMPSGVDYEVPDVLTALTNIPGNLIKGLLSGSVIPNLDASKITSGLFPQSMIAGLNGLLGEIMSLIQGGTGRVNDLVRDLVEIPGQVIGMLPSINIGGIITDVFDTLHGWGQGLMDALFGGLSRQPSPPSTPRTVQNVRQAAQQVAEDAQGGKAVANTTFTFVMQQPTLATANPTVETTLVLSSLMRPKIVGNSLEMDPEPWHFTLTPLLSTIGFPHFRHPKDLDLLQWYGSGNLGVTRMVAHFYRVMQNGDFEFIQTQEIPLGLLPAAPHWANISVQLDTPISVNVSDHIAVELAITGGNHKIAGLYMEWADDDESTRPKRFGAARTVNAESPAPEIILDNDVAYSDYVPFIGMGVVQNVFEPPPPPSYKYTAPIYANAASNSDWIVRHGALFNNPATSASPTAAVYRYATAGDEVVAEFTHRVNPTAGGFTGAARLRYMIHCSSVLNNWVGVELSANPTAPGDLSLNAVLKTGTSPSDAGVVRATVQNQSTPPPFEPFNSSYTATLPSAQNYTLTDQSTRLTMVALGGGAGGESGSFTVNGRGGSAGRWNSKTIIRGVDIPWNEWAGKMVTYQPGSGGAGGKNAGAGANGTASTVTGAVSITGPGGSGLISGVTGESAGSYTAAGQTYSGGSGGGAGADGGGGAGGGGGAATVFPGLTTSGGDGGRGSVWRRAYNVASDYANFVPTTDSKIKPNVQQLIIITYTEIDKTYRVYVNNTNSDPILVWADPNNLAGRGYGKRHAAIYYDFITVNSNSVHTSQMVLADARPEEPEEPEEPPVDPPVDGLSYGLPLLITSGAEGGRVVSWSGSGAPTDVVTGLNTPRGVAVDANGNVYVAQYGSGVVTRWNGTTKTDIITGLNSPRGVAVDANGNVYVAQLTAGVVTRWNGTTKTDIMTGLGAPQGVAVDANGNVYVTQATAGVVTRWNGTTKTDIITGLNSPRGVAVDGDGNVYVTQGGSGVVTRWDGTTKTDIITGLSVPWGVAVDANGNVYVTQGDTNVVTRWDGTTKTDVVTGLDSMQFIALTPQAN